MKNIFLEKDSLKGNRIFIDGENYHYLKNVRRIKLHDKLNVIIQGYRYYLIVSNIKNGIIVCEIKEKRIVKDDDVHITIYQGLLKSKKMDYVISRLGELGVDTFIPFKTLRAVPDLNIRESRIIRWKKLAIEGTKVSGFERVMEIKHPISIDELEKLIDRNQKLNILIFCTQLSGIHIRDYLESDKMLHNKKFHLFFGPEGGFSLEEVNRIIELGGIPVSLGDFILKSETASIIGTGFIRSYCSWEIDGKR